MVFETVISDATGTTCRHVIFLQSLLYRTVLMSLVSSVRICGYGSSDHGRLCPHSGTCVSSRTASGHPRPTLNSLVREGKKEPAV